MSDPATRITAACIESFADTPDPRRRELARAFVGHLHAFIREVEPSRQEWEEAVGFLTRVGHTCVGARQEFILLSDVLGASMLVETLNEGEDQSVTENTVLGPFYVNQPPIAKQGDDIAGSRKEGAEPLEIAIRVVDTDSNPVPGAAVDIWQCAPDGLYDVQRDMPDGHHELRARFLTNSDGMVSCRSIVPVPYQIPSDGPVGDLLAATSRHPWRPAHVHFRIAADGHETLTTHLFPAGDPYLGSDAVFGVKSSLIVAFEANSDTASGIAGNCKILRYTFVLAPD